MNPESCYAETARRMVAKLGKAEAIKIADDHVFVNRGWMESHQTNRLDYWTNVLNEIRGEK